MCCGASLAGATGWLPNRVTPEQVRESRVILDTLAAEYDRDPSTLTINIHGQEPERGLVESYLEAGANRVIVRLELCESEDEMGEELERVARRGALAAVMIIHPHPNLPTSRGKGFLPLR